MKAILTFFLCLLITFAESKVELGVDVFFKDGHLSSLKNQNVGLVTNHTGVNANLQPTADLLQQYATDFSFVAIFAPEHGFQGLSYAGEHVEHSKSKIPIYSLHGKTRRPTDEMLKNIDVLIFDIQDIGSRSYTYISTLFFVMEEAAKRGIRVIVLDRPNPMGGKIVDGPMLQENFRSFIGYINVPYCHGMTIGELAKYFNQEYRIGCRLEVICMRGWKRFMTFKDTGLFWVPTSPNIPESDTPFFYASTGLIGELGLTNIGIGYTLPFKVIGAPWIKAQEFAKQLNSQNIPGVKFLPFAYRPFYGLFKGRDCQGVRIVITDYGQYKPLTVQYLLIGMLKSLYPKEVGKRLALIDSKAKDMFCKANGNEEILSYITKEKYIVWKMISFQENERNAFVEKREKYLLY
ncbi:MAG: DUF1343 domain-containing protein [Chlamydiae bacterium]|nr:DUF1343 domain-containing protein [Chlamydiota bacterium]